MRRVKLLGLMALALFAFGAFTATSAFAVDANVPEFLCLEGTDCAKELKGVLTATNPSLVGLSGKEITATKAEVLLNQGATPECELLAARPLDFTLCKDVPIHFTGVKREGVACRSENLAKEKDPIETVLALLDLHMSTETTATGVLQSLILARVLAVDLDTEVIFNCGVVKIKVLGWIGCLANGLETTKELSILCKVNATSHDPETGTCNGLLCEELKNDPLMATINGATFEDAWELIHLLGTLNKSFFIDD